MTPQHVLFRKAFILLLDTEDGILYDAFTALINLADEMDCPIADITAKVKSVGQSFFLHEDHGLTSEVSNSIMESWNFNGP